MEILEFKYGKGTINIQAPKDGIIDILQGEALSPIKDAGSKIKETFKYPIKAASFYETFKKGDKVAIVVSDRTRNSGSKHILPIILNELNSVGIKDEDVFIMFACGTHRNHTRDEHAKIAGDDVIERVKVFDHDSFNEKELVYLGTTSRGTPVKLNKRVVEADKVILTGVITYHYFAGYGGGRKSVLPGISSFETIQTNHKLLIKDGKVDHRCATGKLDGNPIHEDMIEAAKMLQPDFMVNTILADDGKIAAVIAGDFIEAHLSGCEFLDDKCKIDIHEKADMVIAGSGGGSKDINFVQSHKAMEHASYALKDGGVMVLIAESSEGFPGEDYFKYIDLGSSGKILQELSRKFTIPGHTVHAAFEKAERFKIIWVSKMDSEIVSRMGMIPESNVAAALDKAYKILTNDPTVYIIPQAYNTFPYFTS